MSTTLLKESINKLNIQCGKSFVVSVGRPKLAELVGQRMDELNLSTNAVARRSGNAISNGTVWNIRNNRVQDIKEETLIALAKALDLSKDEVMAAYYDAQPNGDSPIEEEIGVLFYGWEDADDEAKAETMAAIKMIAESFQRRRRTKRKK